MITALVPLLGSSGDEKAEGAPPVVPTPSAPASLPSSAPPPTGAETPEPDHASPPPTGSEHWRGSLLLDHEPKDLDAEHPVAVGSSGEGDVYTLPGNEIEGWNGTVISVWSGRGTGLPGFEECSGTVDAEGTAKQRLTRDTVLCVRTSAGNIARLELTALGSDGVGGDNRAMFDAVVWKASRAGRMVRGGYSTAGSSWVWRSARRTACSTSWGSVPVASARAVIASCTASEAAQKRRRCSSYASPVRPARRARSTSAVRSSLISSSGMSVTFGS
ncbi:hypothetical protein ACFY9A_26550 [Streptomyces rubradiris]|uniref:hypothetical protein n=1 Tax=Streptomyces rubradiris TaxID=285531 RepID=UPI0036EF221D